MRIAAVLLLILCGCPVVVPCRIVPAGEKGPHNMAELAKCCANLKEGSAQRCDACADQPQCGFCMRPKTEGAPKCMARESVTTTVAPAACGGGWCYNSAQCDKPEAVPPGAVP